MTCDEVRERLSDHLLSTLSEEDSVAVAAHLRGCGGCRAESAALADGLAAFASASHDREPPEELAERVSEVLHAEWAAAPTSIARRRSRFTAPWMAAAAAVIALAGSLGWGLEEHHTASVTSAEGASYTHLLQILGGKEFRAGPLQPAPGRTVEGSVVVYDSSKDQSWAAVFVRAPGAAPGKATATLEAPDGRTIQIWPLKIPPGGDGSAWLDTSTDLTTFDHLSIRDANGALLATADIQAA
ncbi:MAG: putative zinc-finger [Actinomycetota bacterium]|nr:putative zinc-finger [Actinomycetota bacterium]